MKRGMTILEILISAVIIVMVISILWSALSSFRNSNDITSANATIIGVLQDARARSLASQSNTNYGVHFETTKTVLFLGNSYSSSTTTNEVYLLPGSVQISAVGLTGGAVDVVFSRLGATTTVSGTVTIASKRDSSNTKTITIFSTGVVQ